MIRNWYVTVLMAALCHSVGAQTEVNVSLLTGRAGISIPLVSAYAGGIEIPVSLSYDGGGVRVNETEGNAGIGWNLVAGDGVVVREVRGLPDDLSARYDARTGWLYSSTSRQALATFSPTQDNGCTDWNTFSIFTGLTDTEPDIFQFNAPGLSGKFVFGNDNVIRLLNYQDLSITYTIARNNEITQISSFTITTALGVKYQFSKLAAKTRWLGVPSTYTRFNREQYLYSYSPNSSAPWYNYAWYLEKITGPNGESVDYSYESTEGNSQQNTRRVNAALTRVDTIAREQNILQTSRVSSITTSTGYAVNFTWSGTNRISSLVCTQGNINREFTFVYASVHNPQQNFPINGKGAVDHDYLARVFEQASCDALPAYTFEYYNPESLPYVNGYPQDLFGYYNNATVTEPRALIPTTYQNAAVTNGEQFRFYPKPGYTAVVSDTARNVNPATSYYGSLKKIIYPSGGYSELAYEPNQYYDSAVSANAYGSGIRVKSLRVSDGDTDASNDILKTYSYKTASGVSSGHWLYTPVFAFFDGTGVYISPDNLAPDETIYYDRATITEAGNGSIVYEYLTQARYPRTVKGGWTATKSRVISPSCTPVANMASGYYTFPFAPNTTYDFEQGLVSKVQYINTAGKIVSERLFTYQLLPRAGVPVKAMHLEKGNVSGSGAYAYGLYTMMTDQAKPVATETIRNYDDVSTTLNVTSVTNYLYQASGRLQENNLTNSDGISLKTQYKYAGDFTVTRPASTDLQARMIRMLQKLNRQATVIETSQWSGTIPKASVLNSYDSFGTAKAYVKAVNTWAGSGTFQPTAVTTGAAQQFTSDPSYIVTRSFSDYTSQGKPGTVVERSRAISSSLYASDNYTPVALLANARGNQVVYADFEDNTSFSLAGAAITTTDVWGGSRSGLLAANGTASRTGLIKAQSANYRFRCRAKATTASNITLALKLTNTSGGVNTINIIYPATKSGQWVLLEQIVPMSTVAATSTLQLVPSAAVAVDDVMFYPADASISSLTFTAQRGKTSVTDNRGMATFYEYDWLGRPTYARNTDKDILESHDYKYAVTPRLTPKAGFTCVGCDNLYAGNTFGFKAVDNCVSPVTYTWRVDGATVGTGSTLTYVFAQVRKYTVQLTVEHPVYGSNTSSITYEVMPQPVLTQLWGNFSLIQCGTTNDTRTFTITTTGCYDNNSTLTCNWYIKTTNVSWTLAQTTTGISSFTVNFAAMGTFPLPPQIRCELVGQCSQGVVPLPILSAAEVTIPLAYNPGECAF